jgi:hypothetical protein
MAKARRQARGRHTRQKRPRDAAELCFRCSPVSRSDNGLELLDADINARTRWPDRRCPVGLVAGALIGDHLMGQQKREQEQAVEAEQNDRELERLRRENQRLREERIER